MNAEKLKKLGAEVRIGGKGMPRRKKKIVHTRYDNFSVWIVCGGVCVYTMKHNVTEKMRSIFCGLDFFEKIWPNVTETIK